MCSTKLSAKVEETYKMSTLISNALEGVMSQFKDCEVENPVEQLLPIFEVSMKLQMELAKLYHGGGLGTLERREPSHEADHVHGPAGVVTFNSFFRI